MKRLSVFAILGVLLISVGFTIGYMIPRRQAIAISSDQLVDLAPQIRLIGPNLQPVETTFKDWLYPQSNSNGKWKSSSGSLNGNPFEFQTNASMQTDDDFGAVLEHYSDKLRNLRCMENDPFWSLPLEGAGSVGENGVLTTYKTIRDRSVQVGVIAIQAENCHVHICVTRGNSLEVTHITVLFSKWHVEDAAEAPVTS